MDGCRANREQLVSQNADLISVLIQILVRIGLLSRSAMSVLVR